MQMGDPAGVDSTHKDPNNEIGKGKVTFGGYKTGLEYFVGATVGPATIVSPWSESSYNPAETSGESDIWGDTSYRYQWEERRIHKRFLRHHIS